MSRLAQCRLRELIPVSIFKRLNSLLDNTNTRFLMIVEEPLSLLESSHLQSRPSPSACMSG